LRSLEDLGVDGIKIFLSIGGLCDNPVLDINSLFFEIALTEEKTAS
jgi:hypothetical protein